MSDIKSSLGVKEMRNYKPLLQQLFAEALGTFLYTTIAPLGDNSKEFSVLSVAVSNGLLVGSIVQIIGNVSGGHINPAVTLGALVCGQIKALRALCYVAVQIVGAIAGAVTSHALLNKDLQEFFGGIIQYGHCEIFVLELTFSFILVAVSISVTDLSRGARGLGSSALAIGVSITACECSCSFYMVGMNPVRMLAPGIVAAWSVRSHGSSRDWSRLWIYCVAPLLGGLIAGLAYRFVLNLKVSDRQDSLRTT